MNRFATLLLLSAPLLFAAHSRPRRVAPVLTSRQSAGPTTILEDVSVVDVLAGRAIPHQDVVIRGASIAAVRDARTRRKDTRYVIPGLWDMHVHLWFPHSQMPLYIANGVTGVRDMGTDLKRVRSWQKQIAAGETAGPRIYACGSPVSDAASTVEDMPVNVVKTPAEARTIFNQYYDSRVDFIKVLNLSPKAFEALAEVSRHDGIPFAGYLPWGVSAFEAAADRMVSMEHLFGIGLACSRKESELRKRALAARERGDADMLEAVNAEIIDTYDSIGASALWDTFRRYSVWQTPTLSLWERMARVDDDAASSENALKYVEGSRRKNWPAPKEETNRAQYEFAFRLTGEMAKAGVGILAGTDTGDPWTVPGFELHRELSLLVKAGLSPAEALRSATVEPAKLMHRERDLGQVTAGYAADLVVLSGNPLANIRNTRTIETVVSRGHVFDKAALARMLSQLAVSATKS